ncbi:FecR family protein [Cyclobacterium qasimii]|uniref:Anti-FecI sigma factor, FecR n=2 Tax=Cyclobacterium qasimii TaxID=1350429 RepID=S7VK66_9BACT|nr:FecR family protein [Cyclobacterium qasimii]EPR69907.1 anti-FecI sigma factor, FecR [Cyclobacterium qasimii M12-11B]GEO20792.1 anti-sigma factor [Cyclobacterium qasimii]
MDKIDPEELIIKQLSGETSKSENDFLKKWLAMSEENRKLYHFHKAMWIGTSHNIQNVNRDRIFNKVHSRIHSSPNQNKTLPSKRILSIPVYARVASVVLIAMFGALAWYFLNQESELVQPVAAAKIIQKEATSGQKLKTFLPDGSVAWLNAESKITYSEFFSDTLRLVHLEGMAYFDVAKDSLRPFVVSSDNVNVTALGTAFTVRSYSSEDILSVALERGRVAVELIAENNVIDEIFLEPGREINCNVEDHTYTESAAIPDNSYNWRDGVLHFENASFSKVMKELNRWYGVEILALNQPTETWSYTATFRNFSLKEVLQSISYTKDFKFEIHPEKVIIKN